MKATHSYEFCLLSRSELEKIFDNLLLGTSRTITISGNWGANSAGAANTAYTRSSTTTSLSKTITISNTTDLDVGMQVVGTGSPLTTAAAVTIQGNPTNTITRTNHGLENDDEISFSSIATTTNISVNTIYYIINKTDNTFQISLTPGGSVRTLTNNGSGNIRYRTEIVSIVPNTSLTMSRPMTSSATNNLVYRFLKTGTALLKGWSVTG
jgi:hypothetical protein